MTVLITLIGNEHDADEAGGGGSVVGLGEEEAVELPGGGRGGVQGTEGRRGPGVVGAEMEKGAGAGMHPGRDLLQPAAMAQRTLFLAINSVTASAAS